MSNEQDPTWNDIANEQWHTPLAEFHAKEAAKYQEKAEKLEAAGKPKAAARMRKAVERNVRLAEKHRGSAT